MKGRSVWRSLAEEKDILFYIIVMSVTWAGSLPFSDPTGGYSQLFGILLGFLVSFALITKRWRTSVTDDSTAVKEAAEKATAQLKAYIAENAGIVFRGGTTEAIAYLDSALAGALTVKNLFAYAANETPKTVYGPKGDPDTIELYRRYLGDAESGITEWTDLASCGEHMFDSYKKRFQGMSRDTLVGRFHFHRIDTPMPLVNFIIIEGKVGGKEALFGWGLHDEERLGAVFLSRNSNVVGYFEKYFEALKGRSAPDKKDNYFLDFLGR